MQRIQGATAQNGKFTEGDPSTAIPATIVSATWLNGVQEELIKLLTISGIAPSEADDTQISQALERLYGGGVEILTLLTSEAVSGVVTAALGARTRPVVIVVAGGSSSMSLHITGSIPEGCEVPVVNWTNGPLTVTSDSDVIGSGNVVSMREAGRLLQGTSQWFLQISPSASSVASSIATAVSGESQARIAGDQALQSQLNSEAQTRALADSTESQVREAADQTLTTNLATETQRAQSAEQGITSEVGGLTTRVGDLESFQAKVIANSFSKAIPGAGPFQAGIPQPILSEALSFPSKGLWEVGIHLAFRANWVGQNAGEADHETWMLALLRNQGGAQVGRAINGLRVSLTSTISTSAYFTKYAAIAVDIGDTELEYGLGLHITVPVPGDANQTLSLQGGEFVCRKVAD